MLDPKWNFGSFLDRYYNTMKGAPREIARLLKADDRYDFGSTDYFDPVYSARYQLQLHRSTTLYRLLPKVAYADVGDSFKYIGSESANLTNYVGPTGEEGALFGADTEIPTLSDIDHIWPGIMSARWESTFVAEAMQKIQTHEVNKFEVVKDYFEQYYAHLIDGCLGGGDSEGGAGVSVYGTNHGVDTPATSTNALPECIDRMICSTTESTGTSHVSAATDGDIYWNATNTGTAKIDRDTDTWATAQVKLPSTAGTAEDYDLLSEIDDIVKSAKYYMGSSAEEREVICITTPATSNKIGDELMPNWRTESQMDYTVNMNGVSTRPGAEGGKYQTASIYTNGLKIPVFESESLPTKNSVYSTATSGHIYFVNVPHMHIRVLFPFTYMKEFNSGDWILGWRHVYYSALTLVCDKFVSQAAIKWIKA